MSGRHDREEGAAAVEFALVLVPLLILVMGIISVGHAYFELVTLTNAAREGARTMAIKKDAAAARAQAVQAAPGLPAGTLTVSICNSPTCPGETTVCPPDIDVEVTVAKPYTFRFFVGNQTVTLTGRGVMRCGG